MFKKIDQTFTDSGVLAGTLVLPVVMTSAGQAVVADTLASTLAGDICAVLTSTALAAATVLVQITLSIKMAAASTELRQEFLIGNIEVAAGLILCKQNTIDYFFTLTCLCFVFVTSSSLTPPSNIGIVFSLLTRCRGYNLYMDG